jgi:hypothetical protein
VKDYEYQAVVMLTFEGLTPVEIAKLEGYIREGFLDKDWGMPAIEIEMLFGKPRAKKTVSKAVTKEGLLALEKSGGKSCGT